MAAKHVKSKRRVPLKPAKPFDLIRLIARSQHDARKAVCELVQNSLDAQASSVEITWYNDAGVRALRVTDNGTGIFPELPREAALDKIAKTIGHSYKRSLTPEQRRELMALGKYGIGLLGFWSVGQLMEIRSRVGGGDAWVLTLREDDSHADLGKAPPRKLVEADTYTQITIRGVHEGAERQLRPARLHGYLASELRGQLLRRPVQLSIQDRIARGVARKLYAVEPRRFRGKALTDLTELAVPGFSAASVELYLHAQEEETPGRVSLACGGTTIADDLATVDGPELLRSPWDTGRLEGEIDFPDFNVAPGTRRGFQRDQAALAFLDALSSLERELIGRLEADEKRRDEERQQNIASQIRKAFVPVVAALPEYDIFDVRGAAAAAARDLENDKRGAAKEGSALAEGADEARAGENGAALEEQQEDDAVADGDEAAQLFPPGPLATVQVTPPKSVVPPGARKRLNARALDRDGRGARGEIAWSWRLDGPGKLEPRGAVAYYTAGDSDGVAHIEATAREGALRATGNAEIRISEALRGQEKASGIPEPHPIHAPLESWRSRIVGARWEFNTGHRDYVAVQDDSARRFRYLVHLFAKELVLRNFGAAQDAPLLERMVEVLTRLGSMKGEGMPRPRARGAGSAAETDLEL